MKSLVVNSLWIAIAVFGSSGAYSQDTLKTRQLNEVVATGQFEPQSLKQSVYQVRTIDHEKIRLRNATNVQSILNTELGVRFSSDPALGTSDVVLMGMGGQNVKILLDGVPMLDRGATRESLNQIDVNTIDRIEIVEGPMSVVYGTDALAGVINIITKKGADNNGTFSVGVKVQEETVGDEYSAFSSDGIHNENVTVGWQGKRWSVNGGLTRNNFGGWQGDSTGRAKEWLPKDQWLGSGAVGYRYGRMNAWYRLNYLKEDITLLGDVNVNPSTNTRTATDKEYKTNRYTHQAQLEWEISDRWNFNAAASFQDYTRRTQTTTLNLETGDRRLTTGAGEQDQSEFTGITFRGTFLYKLSSVVQLQPGVDVSLNKGAGDRIDKNRTVDDYALFASAEIHPTSSVTVRPGMRFIYNTVYDAPPMIPSVNTRFALSPSVDLRLSYAYGFRAPALRELYFSFFDASHSIKGNPDLKAEYSNSFSGSLAWQVVTTPSLRLSSTLGSFYNAYENRITLAVDPNNTGLNTYINILKYRTTGVTWSNSLSFKALTSTVGFSYIGVYNEFSEEDSSLPSLTWTPELNTTLSYTLQKIGASVSLFYKLTGSRSYYEVVNSGEHKGEIHLAEVDAFHLADLSASRRINRYLDLSFGIRNLFGVTRLQNSTLNVGGAHDGGATLPMGVGRSYFLTLDFHWTK